MLGMIIGVAAVITMVALGTGAQTSIEAQIQSAGTNMIIVLGRQLPAGRRAPGPGQRQHAASRTTRRRSRSCRACSTSPPASNTRGQIVAGNQNWNTQVQGTDVDLPLIRSWPISCGRLLHAAGCRDRGESRRARHASSAISCSAPTSIRSGRSSASRNQPFTVRRRDGEQGPVGHGPGSGRRDLRALHDGDEEAARHHHHPAASPSRRRRPARRRRRRRRASPTLLRVAPQDPAGRSRRLHGAHDGGDGERAQGSRRRR